ncbi:MAG: hypothetical protein AB3X44_04050 [Leptothrix sp. (in: b-proteobacteria)]
MRRTKLQMTHSVQPLGFGLDVNHHIGYVMKNVRFAALFSAVLLVGCATPPQPPVSLVGSSLTTVNSRVGVAVLPIPAADTEFPGAGCLLCYAAASVANSTLTEHTKTLGPEELPKLRTEVADLLRKRGINAVEITTDLKLKELPDFSGTAGANVAAKDFSRLRSALNVDKLVVIDVKFIGFQRNYSSYVPTGNPNARFSATGYLVNLSTNTYEWYLPVNVLKSSDGSWDEPPKFPGLTNAYYQSLEIGKDTLLKPLGQ